MLYLVDGFSQEEMRAIQFRVVICYSCGLRMQKIMGMGAIVSGWAGVSLLWVVELCADDGTLSFKGYK